MINKKIKLALSVCALFLSFAVLFVGVFAATNMSYQISGVMRYKVTNVFCDVTTRVYKSSADSTSLSSEVEKYALDSSYTSGVINLSNASNTGYTNDFTTTGAESENYSNDKNPVYVDFDNTSAKSYFIVISITNNADNTISAVLSNVTYTESNVSNENVDQISSIARGSTKRLVFGLSVIDFNVAVNDVDFSFNIAISNGKLKSVETPVISDFASKIEDITKSAARMDAGLEPFRLWNNSGIEGKRVTKIGAYMLSTSDSSNITMTVYRMKTNATTGSTATYIAQALETVTLTFPENSTTGTIIYSACDIIVGTGETLAFGCSTDTLSWGYLANGEIDSTMQFACATNNYADKKGRLLFDIYVKDIADNPTITNFDDKISSITKTKANMSGGYEPFRLTDNSSIAEQTITKIGAYAMSTNTSTTTMTVYRMKTNATTGTTATYIAQALETIVLTFPANTSVGMVYSVCNITVGSDETLAFGCKTDTLTWGYLTSGKIDTSMQFAAVHYANGRVDNGCLLFDIWVEDDGQSELKALLSGKYLSILGDSISTYTGVSNSTSYNSTIGNNAVYYSTQLARTDTYWQQLIDQYGMNLCVNNSWSGGYLTKHAPNQNSTYDSDGSTSSGMARASYLANVSNVKPDYIVVFIGINDLNAGVSADLILSAYNTMLDTLNSTYPSAKVFCMNMPNRVGKNSPTTYNTHIKTAVNSHTNTYLVDLYNSDFSGETYSTYSLNDNLHPNAVGMDYLTKIIAQAMIDALVA